MAVTPQRRWVTSDPHFGHKLAARIRGFADDDDSDAMTMLHDDTITCNWNDFIRPEDLVFLLGDLAVPRGAAGIAYMWDRIGRLNGQIVLVPGNHDAVHPMHKDSWKHQKEWLEHFDAIQPYVKLRLEGEEVLLAHHPYTGDHGRDRDRPYRLREQGALLADGSAKPPLTIVHGHTHGKEIVTRTPAGTLQIHVGLDAWSLNPVSIDRDVARIIREEKEAERERETGNPE
jgi:calcineurin-like phosphoesterase family protein